MSAKIIDLVQGSPEWVTRRFMGFGGSDAPAALDESPYKTRRELVLEKINRTEADNSSKEFIFAKGHRTESLIRQQFQDLIGESADPVFMEHEKYPELFVSLDGLTSKHGVLEAKLVGKDVLEHANTTGEIPRHHWIQIQHACNVSGADKGQWFGHNGKDKGALIEIPADKKFIATLEAEELALWQMVLNAEIPEIGLKDYLIPEDQTLLQELRELSELCENADIEYDRVKQRVLDVFNHPRIKGAGLTIFKAEKSGSIDIKEIPEVAAVLKTLTPQYLEKFRKPGSTSWTVKLDTVKKAGK